MSGLGSGPDGLHQFNFCNTVTQSLTQNWILMLMRAGPSHYHVITNVHLLEPNILSFRLCVPSDRKYY